MKRQMISTRQAAAALAGLFITFVVAAAAPAQKVQAPGFYRFMLGDAEVTVLNDGVMPLEVGKLLTNLAPGELETDLRQSFLGTSIDTSVNAFLVNTGSKLVLIDTGCGKVCAPTTGMLIPNLRAAGYQPEQVDEIYITHMHGDHLGGLQADGKAVFPSAVVRVAQQEADYWLSKEQMAAAPDDRKGSFAAAMAAIAPYAAAGRFKPFGADTVLVPGVRAVAARGHTPGHTVYVVESKGQRLVLWGDLMHVASVQFPNPAVTVRFDSDSVAAAAARKRIFADAAGNRDWVGGAHLSFPGVGHLRAAGSGYVFVPANYDLLH
jgi:glyoxylase-like metal-dependent hydrolase (beta-lactamase superfamily II)